MEVTREHNDVLLRLRDSGIKFAIDDFGNGYSSLDYLSRFPVDDIKIAQNFILDLPTKPRNAAIVRAAIHLAHELGLLVVVEGVETAEELAIIKSWGCRLIQGCYFSEPLPAAAMTMLLGIGVSARTVNKYLPKRPTHRPRGDLRWSTFLRLHAKEIVACDFLVAVTATFRLLYVFVVIEHRSRRLVHCNVTAHPNSAGTLQQLREVVGCEGAVRIRTSRS